MPTLDFWYTAKADYQTTKVALPFQSCCVSPLFTVTASSNLFFVIIPVYSKSSNPSKTQIGCFDN